MGESPKEPPPGSTDQRSVAIITQGFFTGGGVPAVTKWLAEGLVRSGRFQVDIFNLATSADDVNSRRLTQPLTWFRRTLRGPLRDGVQQWGANAVEVEPMRYRRRRELSKALRRYDLVQAVGGSPAVARAALGLTVPVAIQAATTVSWERQSQLAVQSGVKLLWRRKMTAMTTKTERIALRGASAVFVENDDMAQLVRSTGQKNVLKAPPGVDTEVFAPPTNGRLANGYFLSVCRLGDPRKGLDRTLRAYQTMRMASTELPTLVLAGKGELRAVDRSLITELGLSEYVEVRSDLSLQDLRSLYREASVFLQTSHEEGLGISVLEAMASGLPVVATETSGSKEVILDGHTGWVVPQTDESRLIGLFAEKALDLFANNGEAFGRNARARAVLLFAKSVTLARFIDTYDTILRSQND